MNKTSVALVVAVLVIVAGALWYTQTPDNLGSTTGESSQESTLGTYAYTCDNDVAFLLTVSSDMSTIRIEPVTGMSYPSVSTLADSPTDTGRRFRSGNYEFHGEGESVTLYDVRTEATYSCTPQSKPDEAPFNFGD